MLEILLKIDVGNSVVLTGDTDGAYLGHMASELPVRQEPRKLQTFMSGGIQYLKAGDAYLVIGKDESIQKISHSKYYEYRKVSNYEV